MRAQTNLPILLDQDGVLADFVTGLYRVLERELSSSHFLALPDPHNLKRFYIDECVDTGDPDLDAYLKHQVQKAVNTPNLFADLPLIPGAAFYAKQLEAQAKTHGFDVIVCTAPHVENSTCHSDKAKWLFEHFGLSWCKNAVMTHDKTLVQGIVLLDDKPNVVGRVKPTWEHLVFDTPYNRTQHDSRVRIDGWSEQSVNAIINQALKRQLALGFCE